jgi:hypothetical protein
LVVTIFKDFSSKRHSAIESFLEDIQIKNENSYEKLQSKKKMTRVK